MSGPVVTTLQQIGNFIGQLERRLTQRMDMVVSSLSAKADKTEVESIPRWYTVSSASAMTSLRARAGDFCVRTDLGTVWVLKRLPPSEAANWSEVVKGGIGGDTGPSTQTRSYVLRNVLTPRIQHGMGKPPITVSIVDDTGRPNYADYLSIDINTLQINFSEFVSGTVYLTFPP